MEHEFVVHVTRRPQLQAIGKSAVSGCEQRNVGRSGSSSATAHLTTSRSAPARFGWPRRKLGGLRRGTPTRGPRAPQRVASGQGTVTFQWQLRIRAVVCRGSTTRTRIRFGMRIAAPTAGANNYTVYLPSDSNPDYINFAVLDQNNDADDAGCMNTGEQSNGIAITSALTGQDRRCHANSTAT